MHLHGWHVQCLFNKPNFGSVNYVVEFACNVSSFNANNSIPLNKLFECTLIILFLVGLRMAG